MVRKKRGRGVKKWGLLLGGQEAWLRKMVESLVAIRGGGGGRRKKTVICDCKEGVSEWRSKESNGYICLFL